MVNFSAHLAASRVKGWERYYVDWDDLREAATSSETKRDVLFSSWKLEFDKCHAFYECISREAFKALLALRNTNMVANHLCEELPGLCKSFNRGYSTVDVFGSSSGVSPSGGVGGLGGLGGSSLNFFQDGAAQGKGLGPKSSSVDSLNESLLYWGAGGGDSQAGEEQQHGGSLASLEAALLEVQTVALPLFQRRRQFCMLNVEALRKLAAKCSKYVSADLGEHLFCELSMSPMASSLCFDFAQKLLRVSQLIAEAADEEKELAGAHPVRSDDLGQRAPASGGEDESKDGRGRRARTETIGSGSVTSESSAEPRGAHRRPNDSAGSNGLSQFDGLIEMVRAVGPEVKQRLVAHRGFHSSQDSLDRPLENTIAAYEQAWTAGMRYCECDITLTLDHKLVLCHDYDLFRLAHSGARTVNGDKAMKPVTQLTFDELYSFPLKNGTYAPLLEDVLQCARRAGPGAKLVIEIKPGADGAQVAATLCYLLCENRELLRRVAVIMSFDLFIAHNFCRFFDATYETSNAARGVLPAAATEGPIHENGGHAMPDRPHILFLTKNPDETNVEFEMAIDWEASSSDEIRAQVEGYLKHGATALDGIYMQFHHSMMDTCSKAAKLLAELAQTYTIGIWGDTNDPDSVGTARTLAKLGVHYINTDLPANFMGPPAQATAEHP